MRGDEEGCVAIDGLYTVYFVRGQYFGAGTKFSTTTCRSRPFCFPASPS